MRRAALALSVLLLTACGGSTESNGNRNSTTNIRSYDVELPDHRTVTCVVYPNAGGITCDWQNAR